MIIIIMKMIPSASKISTLSYLFMLITIGIMNMKLTAQTTPMVLMVEISQITPMEPMEPMEPMAQIEQIKLKTVLTIPIGIKNTS